MAAQLHPNFHVLAGILHNFVVFVKLCNCRIFGNFEMRGCDSPSHMYVMEANNVPEFCMQLLKLMYHAPVTAGYHQSVWTKIGRSVSPAIHRYAPFLNTPLSVIQRWWLR